MTLTVVLLAYAVVVCSLAPKVLAAAWTRRSPRLATALWHTAAASVLISVVGAGISCTTSPGMIQTCIAAITGHTGAAGVITVAAALLTPGLLLTRLAAVTVAETRSRRTDRRRHIKLLSLLGRPDPRLGITVIPGNAPVAYCVPGTGQVILTAAAVDLLQPAEVHAILAHEQAHLAGRHHLLTAWARVLARAFPGLPLFQNLQAATANLVELLADDHAVRRTSRESVVSAIAAFAGAPTPAAGLAASGGQVLVRVQRLLNPPPQLPVTARLAGTGVAAALLSLPALLILAPALIAGLAACPFLG